MNNKLTSIASRCFMLGAVFVMLTLIGTSEVTNAPEIEWNRTFGEKYGDFLNSVQQTTDGGYILTGLTSSYGAGGSDAWLIKTDSNGQKEWSRTFGGWVADTASTVQQTTDGGYILAGLTVSYAVDDHNSDAWLIKTDSEGEEEWSRVFGGSSYDEFLSVQQTTDGGYILAGSTESYGAGRRDAWLIKTDSKGNEEWSQTFGGSSYEEAFSVQQTTDGGYILVSSAGENGAWLIKTDSEGKEEWSRTFGEGIVYSVQQTSDDGYILAGLYIVDDTEDDDNLDAWLIKTDSKGEEEWRKTFGGLHIDYARSVQQTTDGGYIIAGFTGSDVEKYGAWLIKTDSKGEEEWNEIFGSPTIDDLQEVKSVQQTSDGGYILTGTTTPYSYKNFNVPWLIKIAGKDDKISTSINPPTIEKPPEKSIPGFGAFGMVIIALVVFVLRRKQI